MACEEGLNIRKNPIIPTDNVIEMVDTVLNNNNFSLGDKHYIQSDGIAIGSKLGKNFACSYMRKWDEKFLEYENKPLFYKRFIDDGFGNSLDRPNHWRSSLVMLKAYTGTLR